MSTTNSRFQRRYPPELRERAVRGVREAIAEEGERLGVVSRVARQLGIGPESLLKWISHARWMTASGPGVASEERRRIVELEKENRDATGSPDLTARSAFERS